MSESGHHHIETYTGVDNRKFAMWSLIASECFLFGTLITNYMISRNRVINGPKAHEIYDINLTTISSFILLLSSVAMALAFHHCKEKNLRAFQKWTGVVIVAGIMFLGCQVYEFNHFNNSGLGLSTSVFGASFYMLTGCHGAHVFVGVLWQLSILFTSLRRGEKWLDPDTIEVAGLYWHFVDVIWIVIFTVVYLITYLV